MILAILEALTVEYGILLGILAFLQDMLCSCRAPDASRMGASKNQVPLYRLEKKSCSTQEVEPDVWKLLNL